MLVGSRRRWECRARPPGTTPPQQCPHPWSSHSRPDTLCSLTPICADLNHDILYLGRLCWMVTCMSPLTRAHSQQCPELPPWHRAHNYHFDTILKLYFNSFSLAFMRFRTIYIPVSNINEIITLMICRFCLISMKDFQKLVIMYHLGNYTKLLYYVYN